MNSLPPESLQGEATQTVPGAPATPPQWAWAQPQAAMQMVETEPLEYQRLYRGAGRFRAWKPLLVAGLSIVFYLLFSLVAGLVWVVFILAQNIQVISDPDPFAMLELFEQQLVLDTQNPLSIVMGMLSVIIMIPSVWLAMLIMGVRPLGRVWSVALKIRWKLLFAATGLAVLGVVGMNFAGIAFEILLDPSILDSSSTPDPAFDARAAVLSMVFVVLLVPLQATAEEVMFRGMLMQTLGAWSKHLALIITASAVYLATAGLFFLLGGAESLVNFAIISAVVGVLAIAATLLTGSPFLPVAAPTLIFALMHIYDVWGMLAVGLMGFFAAWLTWRTGGLEAAMGIHIVNNLVAFGFMALGAGGSTAQTEDGGGPGSVLGSALGLALFAWLVVIVFKRGRYGRTRIDLIEAPVRAAPLAPQPAPVAVAPEHPERSAAAGAPVGTGEEPPTSEQPAVPEERRP